MCCEKILSGCASNIIFITFDDIIDKKEKFVVNIFNIK